MDKWFAAERTVASGATTAALFSAGTGVSTSHVEPRSLTYDFLIAKYGNKKPAHPVENKRRRPSLIADFRDSHDPIGTCDERSRTIVTPPVYTEVAVATERALTKEGSEAAF